MAVRRRIEEEVIKAHPPLLPSSSRSWNVGESSHAGGAGNAARGPVGYRRSAQSPLQIDKGRRLVQPKTV